MKRAILIATGTVGGLGAVLAITPPTFTSNENSSMALPGAAVDPAGSASTPAATQSAAPTKSATAAAPAKATPSKSAATNNSQSQTPASTPTKSATVAPVKKAASGTFTGDSVDVRYGYVQVKITMENGKITDAQAVTAPSGRNDRWTQMSVPVLRQQTLQAQSANISGVSGASFTSYGWYTSLVSALAKAGM